MKKRGKKSRRDSRSFLRGLNNEIYGIFTISLGLIVLTALQTNGAGRVGDGLKTLLMGLFADNALILPYIMVLCGILIFIDKPFWKKPEGLLFFFFAFTCILLIRSLLNEVFIQEVTIPDAKLSAKSLFSQASNNGGVGLVGGYLTYFLIKLFGQAGSYIIVITSFLISLMIYTEISLLKFASCIKAGMGNFVSFIKRNLLRVPIGLKQGKKKSIGKNDVQENLHKKELETKEDIVGEKIKVLDYTSSDYKMDKTNGHDSEVEVNTSQPLIAGMDNYQSTNQVEYDFPDIDLLNQIDYLPNKEDKKKILSKAKILEKTLKNFGVNAKVLQVSRGPTITRYELQPQAGVKVSKIVNLSDDIALNLAAPAIRIEAPIPGKAAIGVEIPNDDISLVSLKEIIDSEQYRKSTYSIPFTLGKDISGNPVIADITRMPHLLIAGATGSGKSVCINSLIIGLLYKLRPEYVRLILIDPKVVELNNYNGIPHLLVPVITDAKQATSALNWAIQEMNKRYKIFGETGVRDIDSYNKKFVDRRIPYLIIVIDELADLMLVAPNEVEDSICRLAQMARAAGIHLIIATQRPSVDVITGVIKANIPSRIAFSVASQTDSRTILDMGGAEKLLGKGDMLFYPMGANKPQRLQGAFVSEGEIKKVVNFIKEQVDVSNYEEGVVDKINSNTIASETAPEDEYFEDALKIVVEDQQASISMLQRRLRIGYNRAARLIDEMEERGIVGPYEGSKPRQVLVDKEEVLQEGSN